MSEFLSRLHPAAQVTAILTAGGVLCFILLLLYSIGFGRERHRKD